MNITQLKYFSAVGETLNISQAARDLYISQPSLSNAITRLEETLELDLFVREKNKLRLTEAGRCFLEYVNSALALLGEGELKARQLAIRDNNCIRIASSLGILNKMSADYLIGNSDLRIEVSLCDTEELVKKVLSSEVDFGINFGQVLNSQLLNRVLLESKYYVSVNKSHRFAQRRTVLMEDLKDELLFCSNIGHTYEALQSMFSRRSSQYRLLKLDEQAVLFEAAVKGLGDVICVPMMFDDYPNDMLAPTEQLSFIPIIDCPDTGKVVVISKKDHYMPTESAQFLEYLSAKFYRIGENIRNDIKVRCAFN